VEESHKEIDATLKKRVGEIEATLQKKLTECENTLSTTAEIAHAELSTSHADVLTKIYGLLGGQIIYLYKDLGEPGGKHKNLYISYLYIGVRVGTLGYSAANVLRNSLEKAGRNASAEQETYIRICINNFVFYLATMAAEEAVIVKAEEDRIDPKTVNEALDDLERIASLAYDHKDKYWYDYKDTVVWAKFHLGMLTSEQTKKEVELLLSDANIPQQWKHQVRKSYTFYNLFPEHTDKVYLEV
jgi:hypothetical protein